jgi:hypothetical protein
MRAGILNCDEETSSKTGKEMKDNINYIFGIKLYRCKIDYDGSGVYGIVGCGFSGVKSLGSKTRFTLLQFEVISQKNVVL